MLLVDLLNVNYALVKDGSTLSPYNLWRLQGKSFQGESNPTVLGKPFKTLHIVTH